jgi:CRISPR-associated endonuclease Csn1
LKRVKENPVAISSIFNQIHLVVDNEMKKELNILASKYLNDEAGFKKNIKATPLKFNGTILEKVSIYETIEATATRKTLDISFDKKKIESITDTGIQEILLKHLGQEKYQNVKDENNKLIPASELAFSEDGLDEMNKSLLNHKPIYKVRIYEEGNRFAVGHNDNKKNKYVEAAKGTNLFFAIYQNKNGNRNYKTIALNEVIESQKMGLSNAPETDENGNQLLFTLSPNDLVYIPIEDEKSGTLDFGNMTKEQLKRVYKMVSFSGNQAFFILNSIATSIIDKKEFSALNKMEKSIEGYMIKSLCWKLKVDRLGNITKA